jgi:hypothetical protein
MTLAPELQRILDDIDEADRRGNELAAACTDEQFYWRPNGGQGWSIAQCLDHLGAMNIVYGNAIRTGIERARARGSAPRGPVKPGYIGGKFVRSLEPPVKHRTSAPRQGIPGVRKERQDVLAQYRAGHALIRRLIGEATTIDANRARFPNPFIPLVRFSIATGLFVIPAHDRRHLWQAEQVRQAAGFPTPTAGVRG